MVIYPAFYRQRRVGWWIHARRVGLYVGVRAPFVQMVRFR